jgi:hypothetical protein
VSNVRERDSPPFPFTPSVPLIPCIVFSDADTRSEKEEETAIMSYLTSFTEEAALREAVSGTMERPSNRKIRAFSSFSSSSRSTTAAAGIRTIFLLSIATISLLSSSGSTGGNGLFCNGLSLSTSIHRYRRIGHRHHHHAHGAPPLDATTFRSATATSLSAVRDGSFQRHLAGSDYSVKQQQRQRQNRKTEGNDAYVGRVPYGASPPMDVLATMIETTEYVEKEEDKSREGVGKLIQDLFHSDDAKVNAALKALDLDRCDDEEKWDTFIVWGGCPALVHLLTDRLKKAMQKIPACYQVREVNGLPELETIEHILRVMVLLTFYSEIGRVGIATVGGVEAVVNVMKTFPKCQTLQWRGCGALVNSSCCSIGIAKAVESGGMEVLLTAVTNHLDSAIICQNACPAIFNIASGSKENAGLLIGLGGGAAVAKVRTKWRDDDKVQKWVRKLANLFAFEWKAWADEE